MGKTRVKLKRRLGYQEARNILENYSGSSELQLRELVAKYVKGGDETVEYMDFRELRYYWHVLRGIAKKELERAEKRQSLLEKSLKENSKQKAKLEQLSLF